MKKPLQTGSAFVINAIIETSALRVKGRLCKVAVWSNYGRRPGIRYVRVGTPDPRKIWSEEARRRWKAALAAGR